MFWIQAEAGMGKSAFAASLHAYYSIRKRLLGVFFCRYGAKNRSEGKNVIKSLAYQIARRFPESREKMLEGAKLLTSNNNVMCFNLLFYIFC